MLKNFLFNYLMSTHFKQVIYYIDIIDTYTNQNICSHGSPPTFYEAIQTVREQKLTIWSGLPLASKAKLMLSLHVIIIFQKQFQYIFQERSISPMTVQFFLYFTSEDNKSCHKYHHSKEINISVTGPRQFVMDHTDKKLKKWGSN